MDPKPDGSFFDSPRLNDSDLEAKDSANGTLNGFLTISLGLSGSKNATIQTVTPGAYMDEKPKPHMVGINHVALEVGNIEEALAFYSRIFDFKLRGRSRGAAFIDIGDQFIALMEGRSQSSDDDRHFGLVVDDRSRVRELAIAAGATMLEGARLDFLDPWGNRVQVRGIPRSAIYEDGARAEVYGTQAG